MMDIDSILWVYKFLVCLELELLLLLSLLLLLVSSGVNY